MGTARLRSASTICLTLAAVAVLTRAPQANEARRSEVSIITRFAGDGNGLAGFHGDGGPALAARFWDPLGIAVDAAGNVYVADSNNARVRKITPAGLVTTVAGDGFAIADGDGLPATTAGLGLPQAVGLDAAGNLYILSARRVRKVAAATGIITTVAGNGLPGFRGDGGPAIDASLAPNDLAVDAAGNLYIADTDHCRVRKVTAATGIIDTVAGSGDCGFSGDGGPALSADMIPWYVAVDGSGNLYIGDNDAARVRKVSASGGIITTVAGTGQFGLSGDGGPATSARLWAAGRLAIDHAGNLYINEAWRVRKVSLATGLISTVAGGFDGRSGDGGPATEAQFQIGFGGLAFDAADNLYIADQDNQYIRCLAPNPHDIPLVGDLDGDGRSDLVVWRPSTGTWFWLTSSSGYDNASAHGVQWGDRSLGDVPFLGDVDGDGKADLIVWRATTGTWFWLTSSSGYSYAAAGAKAWGASSLGDIPLVADLDGDGRSDLIVWRASTGTWFWLTSSSGYDYASARSKQWGSATEGDVPLAGDLDGDGRAELVVWRASLFPIAAWYWTSSDPGYASVGAQGFGGRSLQGDVPMLADMDGDGRSDLVLWRRPTGTWTWLTAAGSFDTSAPHQLLWGTQELFDVPVPADFDGDGKAEPAVWRRATGTWFWLMSTAQYSVSSAHQKQWGS